MPNPYFQFKKFTVWHDKCAMKVGTDGVLLGTWVAVLRESNTDANNTELPCSNSGSHVSESQEYCCNKKNYVLDVGTGTGLIALITAQRDSRAVIDAIDIDKDACGQAIENIDRSPFKDRINVVHQSFIEYTPERKYDLIISNPPFFKKSLKCPDEKRSMARHNDSLPLKQLIEHAVSMLSENGRIALILPVQLSDELDFIIATHRLFIVRKTIIIPAEGLTAKRFMIELSTKNITRIEENTLTLETNGRKRTEQYAELTKEFYL